MGEKEKHQHKIRRGQEERQATGQTGRRTDKRTGKDEWTDGQRPQKMDRGVDRARGQRTKRKAGVIKGQSLRHRDMG